MGALLTMFVPKPGRTLMRITARRGVLAAGIAALTTVATLLSTTPA